MRRRRLATAAGSQSDGPPGGASDDDSGDDAMNAESLGGAGQPIPATRQRAIRGTGDVLNSVSTLGDALEHPVEVLGLQVWPEMALDSSRWKGALAAEGIAVRFENGQCPDIADQPCLPFPGGCGESRHGDAACRRQRAHGIAAGAVFAAGILLSRGAACCATWRHLVAHLCVLAGEERCVSQPAEQGRAHECLTVLTVPGHPAPPVRRSARHG